MKLRPVSKTGIRKSVTALTLIGTQFLTTPAFTMPKPNASNSQLNGFQAAAIASDPLLKGVSIMGDHDPKSKVLYVSPSSKSASAGGFQLSATTACDVLENQWKITYNFPRGLSPEQILELAQKGPFSPYFDSQYGLVIRQQTMVENIAQRIGELEKIRQNHKDIIEEYERLKLLYDNAVAERDAITAQIDALNSGLNNLLNLLNIAQSPEELENLREAIKERREIMREQLPELTRMQVKKDNEVNTIRPQYAAARAKYVATVPNLETLENEVRSLTNIFNDLLETARKSHLLSTSLLENLENAGVGIASASYSVWGAEEAGVRRAISQFGSLYGINGYSVVRLPIFDVRTTIAQPINLTQSLAPGDWVNQGATGTITQGGVTLGSAGAPVSTTIVETSFDRPGDQAPITYLTTTLQNDGNGIYGTIVTRGAYCQASRNATESIPIMKYRQAGGGNWAIRSDTLKVPKYEARASTSNVLYQPVTISYKYLVKTDPTSVSCKLDFNRFQEYISKTGSTGFLLSRKKWSKSEFNQAVNAGVDCEVDINPNGSANLADEQKRIEELRQKFIQEMVAEFAIQFGDGVKVQTVEATAPTSEFFNEAGSATKALCGASIYCQVGSLLLKSADSLFGTKTGINADRVRFEGVFRRSYKEATYTTHYGTSQTELSVQL